MPLNYEEHFAHELILFPLFDHMNHFQYSKSARFSFDVDEDHVGWKYQDHGRGGNDNHCAIVL